MKKFKIILTVVLTGFALLATQCATAPQNIEVPAYKERKLKNGLRVLIFNDSKLPVVSISALVKVGGTMDPLGKSGLTSLTGDLLEKGTKTKSATELADLFGALGTSFSANSGLDFTTLATSGLAENQQELFDLFFEVMTEPVFSNGEVTRMKNETIADVKRGYDQPSFVSSLVFNQTLYSTHPYGRTATGSIRDLRSIRQKDIIKHYLKYFRPSNTTIALVGDLKSDVVKNFTAKLETWEDRPVEIEKFPPLPTIKGKQLLLVNRSDLQQSEVRIGHFGIKRNDPDFLALMVADTVLSGGFNSRLMREIRVKRGLTYGIRSGFDARKDVGPFVISASTRHEKVGELVTQTLNQFEEFYQKGITKTEMEEAVGYLKGSFPRRLETADKVASQIQILSFYGIGEDYLKDFIKNIDKLTIDDINAAIRRHLNPKDMKILVYAPETKTLDQLRPVGTVTVKNYLEFL